MRAGACISLGKASTAGLMNARMAEAEKAKGGTPLPHPLNDRRGEGDEPFQRAGEPARRSRWTARSPWWCKFPVHHAARL